MIRRSLSLVGAALAAFHVWLFAGQVWSGALADPTLIFQWLLAAALVAGLVMLKRQGGSLVFGRKAIAIWVLAAVLHGPAVARADLGDSPVPEAVATLTQTVVGLMGLVGLAFVLAGAGLGRPAFTTNGRPVIRAHAPALIPSAGLAFAPRPPPFTR